MKYITFIILIWSNNVFAECSSRTITDKITDSEGKEIISEQNQVSCADGAPSLESLVGIDSKCNIYEIKGYPQMACKYPNGRWEVINDIEVFDTLSGSDSPLSGNYSTAETFVSTENGNFVAQFTNFSRWASGLLDSDSQEIHDRTVFLALQHAKNGEVVRWTNPEANTSGRMKVVLTTAVQGGICRRMLVELKTRNQPRNILETACYDRNTALWHFLP